jgi:ankyrin repeat protein
MSAPTTRARDDEAAAAAAAEGAGGAPPPPARRRPPPADDDDAYERRLKLTDVIGLVAQNGYAREADACAGLCRETWRCIPAGLTAADADRVRRDHPLWQAIINLGNGELNRTRLCMAARFGSLACARELCDWRADVEAADEDGRTPLHYASLHDRHEIARELLARGANIEAATTARRFTSLFLACERGHINVVRELIARGANVEAATGTGMMMAGGITSLICASLRGRLGAVRQLLARGANIDAETEHGCTSLYMACDGGFLGVVRELLAQGADIEAETDGGETPLLLSSFKGHVDVVRVLLAAGANKNHVDHHGNDARMGAGADADAPPGSRAAIHALLDAAP